MLSALGNDRALLCRQALASVIDKYVFQLYGLLKAEAAKSRKQRRTLEQLHKELRELGLRRVLRPGRGVRKGIAGGSNCQGQFS
jgi:hypothetical protein